MADIAKTCNNESACTERAMAEFEKKLMADGKLPHVS
jgi:hypothetical protein